MHFRWHAGLFHQPSICNENLGWLKNITALSIEPYQNRRREFPNERKI
jgi:hypothetical protein